MGKFFNRSFYPPARYQVLLLSTVLMGKTMSVCRPSVGIFHALRRLRDQTDTVLCAPPTIHPLAAKLQRTCTAFDGLHLLEREPNEQARFKLSRPSADCAAALVTQPSGSIKSG